METTTSSPQTDGLAIDPAPLSMLLDACPDGMLMTDLGGNVVAANKSAAGKLCGKVEYPLGRNLYRHVPPEVGDSMKDHAREVIQSRSSIHFI